MRTQRTRRGGSQRTARRPCPLGTATNDSTFRIDGQVCAPIAPSPRLPHSVSPVHHLYSIFQCNQTPSGLDAPNCTLRRPICYTGAPNQTAFLTCPRPRDRRANKIQETIQRRGACRLPKRQPFSDPSPTEFFERHTNALSTASTAPCSTVSVLR